MTRPEASARRAGDHLGAEAPGRRARDASIHALFEDQAERRPDAVAIRCAGQSVSYGALDARANQIAHALRRRGVGPETTVGVCLGRSVDMIAGALGVLKAGGAYVPLDPAYPASRLDLMVQDTRARALLTHASFEGGLPAYDGAVIRLDEDAAAIAREPATKPDVRTTPDTLAYVMYTSGSTGRPKGVCVTHRNVVRLVRETDYIDVGPEDVFLQAAPISFDASTLELWGALLNGAKLVMHAPRTLAIDELGRVIEDEGVTTLWLTSALFQRMVDTELGRLRGVRQLLAGGDVLSVPHVERVIASLDGDRRLINGYGPTENTTFTCCHVMDGASTINGTVPIGRPIAHTQVYILDSQMRPVPAGEPGELYAGGDGVARGYLHAPAATAERFVPDPFSDKRGARLYRTGDLARWRDDGTIEFIGRADRQIKLRGFRIELGEIESALRADPAVRDAAVLCREDVPGDRRLVAYVVSFDDASASRAHLRSRLREQLPDHMIPAAFVPLDAFPLTPNGKIDHRALPAPAGDRQADTPFVAPRNESEATVAAVYRDVLHLDTVGAHDDFFDLGGHSLTATMVASRLRHALDVDVTMGAVFAHPTVADLATTLDGTAGVDRDVDRIVPVPRDAPLPLSFSQERVWFLCHLDPQNLAYHFQASVRFTGDLDVPALERSLAEMLRRHEILRTSFHERDERPVQIVHDPGPYELPQEDLRAVPAPEREAAIADRIMRECRTPYDLSRLPLIRWRLLRTDDNEHLLVHAEHHLLHDGWGFVVFLRELAQLYTAYANGRPSPLDESELQFGDFAAWQRGWIDREAAHKQLAYWKRQLDGCPPELTLPFDRPRPAVQGYEGTALRVELPGELCAALRRLSHDAGTTLYVTMLAAYYTLLQRYAGQDDICVGSAVANRRWHETEGMLGMFVNNAVLRANLAGSPRFRAFLDHVRAMTIEAYANEDMPFDRVVDAVSPERDPSRNPLFQTMFSFHDTPFEELDFDGVDVRFIEGLSNRTAKFDMNVVAIPRTRQRAGGVADDAPVPIDLVWEYNTGLFDHATIERLTGHYRRLLEAIVADPDTRLTDLPLLDASERRLVLETWNDTAADVPTDACVHDLFERQAARTPDRVAVADDEQTVTYAELDARANALADRLRDLGVGPEVPVGVYVERGVDMITAVLGVLKAGGMYLPLDPVYPRERIRHMLDDARAPLVVTHPGRAGDLDGVIAGATRVDAAPFAVLASDARDTRRTSEPVQPANAAYVIYTSGSTGRPKGVEVLHRNVVNFLASMQREPGIDANDALLAVTTLSFDIAGLELFLPLCVGARVVIASRETAMDGDALQRALREHGITIMQATPATWQLLVESEWPGDANLTMLCGGEALPPALASALLGRGRALWNMYGPTETTIWSSIARIESADDVTLGRPIGNTQLYVLDANREPAPIGVPGELFIGGAGVTRGYRGRPELTADRFVSDPFGAPGARLYRTGDVVRARPDGRLVFCGRVDHQVKLRGYRIELGEIESALREDADVRDAVVVLRDDAPGGGALAAYVVLGADDARWETRLREHLARDLPEYMIPAAMMRLETLPRLANGKIDRHALPAPTSVRPADEPHVAPRSGTESKVAEIWGEVLELDAIGVNDNFFRLGGHSLMAARVLSRVSRAFDVRLPLTGFFQRPTVAGVAQFIDELDARGSAASARAAGPEVGREQGEI